MLLIFHMEKILLLYIVVIQDALTDKVIPDGDQYNYEEGQSIRLSCKYETNSQNVLLYWYRQYGNQEPQFLLCKGGRSWSYEHIPNPRFGSSTSQDATELLIKSVTVGDSALYYCTLSWLHWGATGANPLTFGKPIKLTVLPKDLSKTLVPVVSVMAPVAPENPTIPDVCLAAGFGDTTLSMSLTLEDGSKSNRDVSHAVLSTASKSYYFAAFENNMDECELAGGKGKKKQKKEDPVTQSPKAPSLNCSSSPVERSSNTTGHANPKTNFMSVLVTGLRILFAKAVAFNTMMTVKVLVY